jgi:AcrR family transcriptional regulator
MDAAVRLFAEKGYHASSTNEIAMIEDVPIGSFYANFPIKKTSSSS